LFPRHLALERSVYPTADINVDNRVVILIILPLLLPELGISCSTCVSYIPTFAFGFLDGSWFGLWLPFDVLPSITWKEDHLFLAAAHNSSIREATGRVILELVVLFVAPPSRRILRCVRLPQLICSLQVTGQLPSAAARFS
tara:strand:- start:8391 stop:8813 length:423 start_codon:yes stop_codon:yes gene_type:complete